MFEVYHTGRKRWKRIIVDCVPQDFATRIREIYRRELASAQDARAISEELRSTIPIMQQKNFDAYLDLDDKKQEMILAEFWKRMKNPTPLSTLITEELIDCNVLSLAIAQVIPQTEIYFGSYTRHVSIAPSMNRHTMTVHPKEGYFLFVDPFKVNILGPSFFCQPRIYDMYKKVPDWRN